MAGEASPCGLVSLGGGAMKREEALALDARDPLARLRERFVVADPELLYLDGNSLGRLPADTRARLNAAMDRWGEQLVTGWHDWIEQPTRVGDALGVGGLGARPGGALVADSTTVNLHKLACAALDAYSPPAQRALVTDSDNFPTDRYVLEGIARQRGLQLRLF